MFDRTRDPVTGLWNDAYFAASLHCRVAVARRALRPLGLVLIQVGDAAGAVDRGDATAREVAYACLRTLRECDQAFRLDDATYALLLEESDERGSVLCSERLLELLAQGRSDQLLWAGVSVYPAHSLDPQGIVDAARAALADARRWTTSRIEVAVLP